MQKERRVVGFSNTDSTKLPTVFEKNDRYEKRTDMQLNRVEYSGIERE